MCCPALVVNMKAGKYDLLYSIIIAKSIKKSVFSIIIVIAKLITAHVLVLPAVGAKKGDPVRILPARSCWLVLVLRWHGWISRL
jgi:hypothetical protein